jgi:uncharacterized protein
MLRLFYNGAGTLCAGLGLLGVIVPLLPTTPFLLLASACYARGSRRLHERLHGHPRLGPYLRAFEEGRGLPARTRAVVILLLWFSLGISALRVDSPLLVGMLAAIGAGVTLYLLSLPIRLD